MTFLDAELTLDELALGDFWQANRDAHRRDLFRLLLATGSYYRPRYMWAAVEAFEVVKGWQPDRIRQGLLYEIETGAPS